MTNNLPRRPLKALCALALILVLSSCYMPIRFDAEIDINRTGYYDFIFDGYLAKVQLYQDLKDGKIGRDEEAEQVKLIKEDFGRDPAASEFKYYEKGHFHIAYKRSGDLLKTKTMTFFRRNEYILGISYNKNTGQITMLGKSLKRDTKDRLRAAGLDTSGELRLFTDGRVVSHNATSVKPFNSKGPNYKMYTWKIPNLLAPTPVLKIQIHDPQS
ncbi:MAG: hypothetical protein JJ900_08375 [Rhodospirillales bacterium]|nr:hypothetical protein [Rhodospirillales bacterium]MBO6786853.1 hypothetical protein [Rhodospirillales bacterium]